MLVWIKNIGPWMMKALLAGGVEARQTCWVQVNQDYPGMEIFG
jgi:hypothetical protein